MPLSAPDDPSLLPARIAQLNSPVAVSIVPKAAPVPPVRTYGTSWAPLSVADHGITFALAATAGSKAKDKTKDLINFTNVSALYVAYLPNG